MRRTYIDPPSGWKYGFPKAIPNDVLKDPQLFEQWLMKQGYPHIDLAKQYSRYWEQDD